MSETVAILSELALTLLQAYMIAAKQAGLSKEEATKQFAVVLSEFKVASANPVDEVKED